MRPTFWVALTTAAFVGMFFAETAAGMLAMAALTFVLFALTGRSVAIWALECDE